MRLLKQAKTKFTNHEIETAIKVLLESKQVRKWVQAEADFLEVDLDTPEGKQFWEREARAAAMRMIS